MSSSDSSDDDELLNTNSSSSSSSSSSTTYATGQKRERRQVQRLGDDTGREAGKAEAGKFDLKAMLRASEKNTKKFQKVGHNSSSAAISKVLAATVDWDFIQAAPKGKTSKDAAEESGGGGIGGNGAEDDDADDDDGEDFEEMGDLDGKIRNVQRGARSLLCRQSALWPSSRRLEFDLIRAKGEPGTKPLHGMYAKLAKLSVDPTGSAEELTELLSCPANGVAHVLSNVAKPFTDERGRPIACGQGATENAPTVRCYVPRVLWSWLMDLIAFHPMDGVVAAAAFAIKSILQQLPEGRGDPAPRGEQGSWDPQRPLTFLSMCGPLTCLGLDPMADDPTSEVDSVPTSPYMSSGAEQPRAPLGLKSRMDFDEVVQPIYSGRNLGALLDVWACCVEAKFHSLSGEEALDIFIVCCLIGADALALAVPRLVFHKDRLSSALLRNLPSPAIWPGEATRRVSALVRAARDFDLKVLILRGLPLARTGSRGKALLSAAVADYALLDFIDQQSDAGAPTANASVEGGFSDLAVVKPPANPREMATALLEKFNSECSVREYLDATSTSHIHALVATIDLLLIAGSTRHDFSVAGLSRQMDEVRSIFAFLLCVVPVALS